MRWLPIVGYEGLYEISDRGSIRVLTGRRVGIIRKPWRTKDGYLKVTLTKNGKDQHHSIHKLVYTSFIGPVPAGMEIDHKDGVKPHNYPENLEAVTKAENRRRARAMGLFCTDKMHCHVGLNPVRVRQIRILGRKQTAYRIAKRFGVNPSTVRSVLLGQTWKDVT